MFDAEYAEQYPVEVGEYVVANVNVNNNCKRSITMINLTFISNGLITKA